MFFSTFSICFHNELVIICFNIFYDTSASVNPPQLPATATVSTVGQPIVLTQSQLALFAQSGRINLSGPSAAAASVVSNGSTNTTTVTTPIVSTTVGAGPAGPMIIKTEPLSTGLPTVQTIPQHSNVASGHGSDDVRILTAIIFSNITWEGGMWHLFCFFLNFPGMFILNAVWF